LVVDAVGGDADLGVARDRRAGDEQRPRAAVEFDGGSSRRTASTAARNISAVRSSAPTALPQWDPRYPSPGKSSLAEPQQRRPRIVDHRRMPAHTGIVLPRAISPTFDADSP
jgi:hypothetical protein